MIDFLLGVPGKLKTISDHLTTYWTAARAAKVDNLDAAISTRAAAGTALSNADYTAGRAAKLDNILSTVIASVQRGAGVNATPVNVGSQPAPWVINPHCIDITISAVTVAKCKVSVRTTDPNITNNGILFAELTSTTNLRMHTLSGAVLSHEWEVVEFK